MQDTLRSIQNLALRLSHPESVRTNQNTGLIRLIACACMVIDHAGKMFFPKLTVLRLIGRLAFPLFAYGIAVGAVYTRDDLRYLSRVVLLALVSQPLYAVALAHESASMYAVSFLDHPLAAAYAFYIGSWEKQPSILLSLSLGLGIMLCLKNRRWALAVGLYVLCERFSGHLDYGVNGIRLMLIFYLLCEHPLLCLAASLSFFLHWASQGTGHVFFGIDFNMRVYAVPAICFVCLPLRSRIRLPRWLIYGFYPAHLALFIPLLKC